LIVIDLDYDRLGRPGEPDLEDCAQLPASTQNDLPDGRSGKDGTQEFLGQGRRQRCCGGHA
jgi:hypothetical protein